MSDELYNRVTELIYHVYPRLDMSEFMCPVHIHKTIIYWRRSLILYIDLLYNQIIIGKITHDIYYHQLNKMYNMLIHMHH